MRVRMPGAARPGRPEPDLPLRRARDGARRLPPHQCGAPTGRAGVRAGPGAEPGRARPARSPPTFVLAGIGQLKYGLAAGGGAEHGVRSVPEFYDGHGNMAVNGLLRWRGMSPGDAADSVGACGGAGPEYVEDEAPAGKKGRAEARFLPASRGSNADLRRAGHGVRCQMRARDVRPPAHGGGGHCALGSEPRRRGRGGEGRRRCRRT